MGNKYRAYAEYIDSNVEMLGDIPSCWSTKQVRYLLKDGAEGIKIGPFGSALKLENMVESGFNVYGQENVIKRDFTLGKRRISEDKYTEMQVYKIFPNDLLITMMGTSGKCELVPENFEPGIIDSHLIRLRVKKDKILPRFFRLLIDECHEIENQIKVSGKGSIMHGLNSSIIKALQLPLPSIDEQENILDFLDHETAKIDTLIEKQQQLIKLLKEKRQAVISHAVTKGLNPDVAMRDSGVEWLGEVPAHWVVTRAKFLFDFVTSGSRGWAEHYSDEGSLFFRIANLTRDTIEPKMESTQKVRPPSGSEGERSKINKGDLLISITADLGSVCVANDKIGGGYVSQHVALCRANGNVESSRWLGYFILSDLAKEQFIGSGYGGTKIQLSLEDIRELWIIQPAGKDQIEIASYIDEQLEKFSKLIGFAEEQINLSKERRTALISAAVTGKIDVRDWQAPEQNQVNKEAAA